MKTILLYIFLILNFITTFAIERPSYFRQSLDYTDGLCDNYIRSINQDSHGYVWVVTTYGLNRFNGGNFIKFTKENSGLKTNELNCILPDPINPDKIWIASRQSGLFFYDYTTGKISQFDMMAHKDVTALAISSDINIWITHYIAPPEKLNPKDGTIHPLFSKITDKIPSRIWCSAEDKHGNYLYLGHEFNGLTRINLSTLECTTYRHNPLNPESLEGQSVYSLYIHSDGKIWIGTENGISIFDPSTERFINHPETMAGLNPFNGTVKAIRGMTDGTIWATSDKVGVIIFSYDKTNSIPSGELLTNNIGGRFPTLTSSTPVVLFEDSYGNLWIGYTTDGIDVMCKEAPFLFTFSPFEKHRGTPGQQNIWSVIETRSGDLWIGGEKEIIQLTDNTRLSYPLPLDLNLKAPVRTIFEDNNGNIWAGTVNSGAFRLNKGDSSFTAVKNIDREIRDIIETPELGIVAATHNGLYHIDNQLNATPLQSISEQLPDRYTTSLTYSNGLLWVGTFGQGAAIIDGKGQLFKYLTLPDGLPSNTVNDITECKEGKIWIATRDGAALYDPKEAKISKVLKVDDGFHSSNFKAIEEDEKGKLWISAEDGLSCFDPSESVISTYTHANKTTLSSFVEGSSCFTRSGIMLFGSLYGLRVFKPSDLPIKDFYKSKTRVSEISAHDSKSKNQNLEISIPINSDKISIPYNFNTFSIRFSNPDISMNGNAEVRYNLKGVNKVWTNADNEQEALYRNLKPGTYRFQVSTRYFGGEWSAPETLLTITITPPLFLTWWAKMIYIIGGLAAVGLVLYFYKYKMDLEKNLAIERENSKNNLLLNEERLMFYTNVTHELRTPLSLIIGPIEDLINDPDLRDEYRKKLYTIRTSSMRLLDLINGILEFRKTETQNRRLEVVYGNLANFVREIGLRFKELNSNKNVAISIDVAEMEDTEMYYDPEMITTILNNLLGNAMKYTKNGTITLSMKPLSLDGTDYVDICVKDTGEGISSDELPHIFKRYYQGRQMRKVAGTGIGLALVKNLVTLHEGTISVESEKGKGSIFTVRLRTKNNYPGACHIDVNKMPKQEAEAESSDISTYPAERLTILVVEDDKDLRDYISNSFSDTFNVICAENGEEGLKQVKDKMPDIVVSDIMMPGMDGIELCNTIKNDITTSHIPVIMLTAKDSLLDKEEGYNSGADFYITKPFSAKLLLSRINNILDSRHRLSLLYLAAFNIADKNNMIEENSFETIEEIEPGQPSMEPKLTPLDCDFINKLKKVVEDNIEVEEMDIAFLTDKMCMSHSTLYRKVKSITGLTPNEFIRKIKLKRALELLDEGKVELSEIPFLTGFNSISYFRRVFKKEYGITPSEYLQTKKN